MRFTRRNPSCDAPQDVEVSLSLIGARFFHAQLGRFISRDPLGYVDGMSLYRAYFVPGGVDPIGLKAAPCQGPCKDGKGKDPDDFTRLCCPEKMMKITVKRKKTKSPKNWGHAAIEVPAIDEHAAQTKGLWPKNGAGIGQLDDIGNVNDDSAYNFTKKCTMTLKYNKK